MQKNLSTTIFVLLFTLLVFPVVLYYQNILLTNSQVETLWLLGKMATATALLCFVVSQATGNCSQVDKLWSVLPIVYSWVMAAKGGFTPLLILMACLVSVWGIRLTYNFSRRGAYRLKFWEGEEDYRWAVLRANPTLAGKWRWMLFNFFFISLYQNALILLFTLPMIVCMNVAQAITPTHIVIAIAMLAFIVIETIADEQQWKFQQRKKQNSTADAEVQAGFVHTGLWKFVRHPNYLSEQCIWLLFYLFSVSASGQLVNWSMGGVLLLLILFQSSASFSEEITAKKYPHYASYQQSTGKFLPKIW